MAAAETGSGKTAAFSLPVLQLVMEAKRREAEGKDGPGGAGAARGAAEGPGDWRVSGVDRDPMLEIEGDGATVAVGVPRWVGGRATLGVQGNGCKAYFETTMLDGGLGRVGWATTAANYNLGTDKNGYGFGGTGMKSQGGKFDPYGCVVKCCVVVSSVYVCVRACCVCYMLLLTILPRRHLIRDTTHTHPCRIHRESFGQGDVIGCFLDLGKGVVGFSKNGKYLGDAFALDPAMAAGALFPSVVLKQARVRAYALPASTLPPASPDLRTLSHTLSLAHRPSSTSLGPSPSCPKMGSREWARCPQPMCWCRRSSRRLSGPEPAAAAAAAAVVRGARRGAGT